MPTGGEKILIVDDEGFCRISSALLETAGYRIETVAYPVTNSEKLLSRLNQNIGLIITSFRHDDFLLREIKKRKIPCLILSDNIDGKLIRMLDGLHRSYCMIKPIDYEKFRSMVQTAMSGNLIPQEGFSIV
jgi:DNA-binding NtrC family response regulator